MDGRSRAVAACRGPRVRSCLDLRPHRLGRHARLALVLRHPDAHGRGDGHHHDPARVRSWPRRTSGTPCPSLASSSRSTTSAAGRFTLGVGAGSRGLGRLHARGPLEAAPSGPSASWSSSALLDRLLSRAAEGRTFRGRFWRANEVTNPPRVRAAPAPPVRRGRDRCSGDGGRRPPRSGVGHERRPHPSWAAARSRAGSRRGRSAAAGARGRLRLRGARPRGPAAPRPHRTPARRGARQPGAVRGDEGRVRLGRGHRSRRPLAPTGSAVRRRRCGARADRRRMMPGTAGPRGSPGARGITPMAPRPQGPKVGHEAPPSPAASTRPTLEVPVRRSSALVAALALTLTVGACGGVGDIEIGGGGGGGSTTTTRPRPTTTSTTEPDEPDDPSDPGGGGIRGLARARTRPCGRSP